MHPHLYHDYDCLHHNDQASLHLAVLGKNLAPHYILQFHTPMTGTAMAILVFASYQIFLHCFHKKRTIKSRFKLQTLWNVLVINQMTCCRLVNFPKCHILQPVQSCPSPFSASDQFKKPLETLVFRKSNFPWGACRQISLDHNMLDMPFFFV